MQNGRTVNSLNTESTLNRVWKVVYKDAESGLPVHTQYIETDYRVDALRLADEKIPTNKYIVTATTTFNRNELLTKREQEETLTEQEKETIEQGIHNSLVEERKAEMDAEVKKLTETEQMTGEEYARSKGWPMANPFTEQAQKVDAMLEKVKEEEVLKMNYPADHQVIKDIIVRYFLNKFLPSMSLAQVLDIFKDTNITFGDLKDFLDREDM